MYHGDGVQKFELCCGYSVRVLIHVNYTSIKFTLPTQAAI